MTPLGGKSPREALVFSGSAFDFEDGFLTPGQLTGISDKDGVLGTGYTLSVSLSPGAHLITLQVIDGSGQVGKQVKSSGWRIFWPLIGR